MANFLFIFVDIRKVLRENSSNNAYSQRKLKTVMYLPRTEKTQHGVACVQKT